MFALPMAINKKPACKSREVLIYEKDLPLSCPMPDQVMWNAHPREYLPIEKTGRVTCPYCGTVYVLVTNNDDESDV